MAKSTSRKRRTTAEWSKLVRTWETSGRGAEAFAQGKDFSASSLYLWRKKLRRGEGAEDPGRGVSFVPLVLEDDNTAPDASGWQIRTREGLAISMTGPEAVHGLEVALRALGEQEAL